MRTTFDSSIEAIASAVEARDGYTEQHCRRLALFSSLMAERVGLDTEEVEAIRLGALLHDVGKIGIRDEILLKPGRFTPERARRDEGNTNIGHRIISGIHGLAPDDARLRAAPPRALGRQRLSGRLCGEETPLGARIVAVVDVWDALSTARPYKPAIPRSRCAVCCARTAASTSSAALVDLFLALLDEEGEELLAWIEARPRSSAMRARALCALVVLARAGTRAAPLRADELASLAPPPPATPRTRT